MHFAAHILGCAPVTLRSFLIIDKTEYRAGTIELYDLTVIYPII